MLAILANETRRQSRLQSLGDRQLELRKKLGGRLHRIQMRTKVSASAREKNLVLVLDSIHDFVGVLFRPK